MRLINEKNNLRIILILYLFLIGSEVFGQDEKRLKTIDSLKQKISIIKSSIQKAEAYINLADLLIDSQRSESKKLLDSAMNIVEQNNQYALLGKIKYRFGLINYKNEKDDVAMAYFNEVDSLFSIHNIVNEDLVHTKYYQAQILKFSFTIEGLKNSKSYLDKMLSYANITKDSSLIYWSTQKVGGYYGVLSEVENKKVNLDSSKLFFNKALNYFEHKKDYKNLSSVYWSLASVETRSGNLDKAEAYHLKRLEAINKTKDSSEKALVYATTGGFYLRVNKPDLAIKHITDAQNLFDIYNYPSSRDLINIFKILSTAYKQKNDYKTAYNYLLKELKAKDSINRESNKQKALELETQYQTKQKEQEISLLKTQNEVALQEKKNQRNLLLAAIGLISLVGLFFFVLYKNRQKTNKKLKEIDDFKSKMFTNLSHEFRTPLTVIQGLSATLEKGLTNFSDVNTAKTIRKNASFLNEQLKQILAIAAVDKSNLKFNFIQADVVSYIKDLVQLFKSYANSSGQDIVLNYNPESIIMDFDPDKIQTIFQNLISNALKFNKEGEVISVDLEQKDTFFELKISDKGIGIKDEQLNKIFKRFYTTSTETNIEGTGIGLAIVKEFVDKLNGEIYVTSKENLGTTFSVKLPITNNAIKAEDNLMPKLPFVYESLQNQDTAKEELSTTKNKKTILVVEDNKDIQIYYKTLLKSKFNIVIAKNGNLALKQLETKSIDFIISDLAMPEMDGFQFSKTLKQDISYSHIPVIIVSANVNIDAKTKGYDLGIDAYLTKPFKEAELLSIIDNLFKKQEEKNNYFSELLALKQPNETQKIKTVEISFVKQLQEIALEKSIYTTQQIAEKLNMSRTKLNQKVNALTNMSVANYIKHIKIEKAKELLSSTQLRISEISFELGYEDASLFSKIFKKHTGTTPSAYKNSL